MGWWIVKQPNGLFARFSGVVDNFTHYDMSESEALDLCRREEGMAEHVARYKVRGAIGDVLFIRQGLGRVPSIEVQPWEHRPQWDGLDRYRDAIKTIRTVHGAKEARKWEKRLSDPAAAK